MGGWWKCRLCEAYNKKARPFCGWCRAPFQTLLDGPSSKTSPIHSHDCVPPGAKGKGKGKSGKEPRSRPHGHAPNGSESTRSESANGSSDQGNGKGKGNKKSQPQTGASPITGGQNVWQKRAAAAATNAKPLGGAHGPPDHFQDVPSNAALIQERMDTVQALINSLVDRSDQLSIDTRSQLFAEMTSLRIQKTKSKPLHAQVTVLENLVKGRQVGYDEAVAALEMAQQKVEKLKLDLSDAQRQLSEARVAHVQEEKVNATTPQGPVDLITRGNEMAALLPKDKAAVFSECLLLLSKLLEHPSQAPNVMQVDEVVEASISVDATSSNGASLSASSSLPSCGQKVGATASPEVPLFPFLGAQAVGLDHATPSPGVSSFVPQGSGKGAAVRDPYGSPIPRGRQRAASVPASPGQSGRSRSTSHKRLRGKQHAPEGFSTLEHHFSFPPHSGTVPG